MMVMMVMMALLHLDDPVSKHRKYQDHDTGKTKWNAAILNAI